jgi:RNA polymerase sigma factor (sigma-70 family)
MSDLSLMQGNQHSESELFDQLTANSYAGPDQEFAANEQAELLLSLVSPEDQHILILALLQGFEREALAQQLGISPGATRVRLHRALKRLRLAWSEQHMNSQKGESNE